MLENERQRSGSTHRVIFPAAPRRTRPGEASEDAGDRNICPKPVQQDKGGQQIRSQRVDGKNTRSRYRPQKRYQIPEISKDPLGEAKGPCQFDLFLKRITDSSQTLHCFFTDPAF
jgi:hypothetical protein